MQRITRELFRPNLVTAAVAMLGAQHPRPEETDRAVEILNAAPRGPTPRDVAHYFAELTLTNADGERYNAEWRVRANPVIVAFFVQATDLGNLEEGDGTAWCAAFVNWCLMRTGKRGTRSASSGSFRCQGREALPPQPGDIAVFKKHGFSEPCEGQGHVGFFISRQGEDLTILGGNQHDCVRTSFYPRGTDLTFLSCRDVTSIP